VILVEIENRDDILLNRLSKLVIAVREKPKGKKSDADYSSWETPEWLQVKLVRDLSQT
jgi:hypothetical protein